MVIILYYRDELTINDQFDLQPPQKTQVTLCIPKNQQSWSISTWKQGICSRSESQVQPAEHIQDLGREEAASQDAHLIVEVEVIAAERVLVTGVEDDSYES